MILKPFARAATAKEIHLGQSEFAFLGPMKFLLFHIIPKSNDAWSLSPTTRTYADWLRWASMAGFLLEIAIVFYILFSLV